MLIDVVENQRLVFVRPLTSRWISCDILLIDAHAPLARLCPGYIVSAEVPHWLLNWVVRMAIVKISSVTH